MTFKDFMMSILAVLIENGKLSIGRLMTMVTFGIAVMMWVQGTEIPTTQLNILLALIGYVLGSKIVGNAASTIKQVKDVKNIIVNNVMNDDDVEPPSNMKGDN
jgi:FtsH-binding integral membrane protein